MINLNKLARAVALKEGGAQELSIAQIKEVMKIVFDELRWYKVSEVCKLLERR